MAFDSLRDLRGSFEHYMDNKVKVTIPALSFQQGSELNPNEELFFDVVATNHGTVVDGIPVSDLRFSLQVSNPNIFQFIVPPRSSQISFVLGPDGRALEPGTLVDSMIIAHTTRTLGVGESIKLDDIRARAGAIKTGGSANITARVFGDPDLSFIFPADEYSLPATRTVVVSG